MSGTNVTPAATAEDGGFSPEAEELAGSLFDDSEESDETETTGEKKTDGEAATDDETPPATDGEEGATDGSEESSQNADNKDGDDPPSIEVDGEVYTPERIKELQEGSLRWNDYTKKTQELGEIRKQVEPLLQLVEKLKADKSLMEDIRESLDEDLRPLFDAAVNLDTKAVQHPDSKELETLRAQVTEYQAREAIEKDKSDLVSKYGITREQADQVLEAAIQYHEEKKVYRDLETQCEIMISKGLIPGKKTEEKSQEKKTTPKTPKIPPKGGGGAKGMKPPAKGGFDTIPLSAFRDVMEN